MGALRQHAAVVLLAHTHPSGCTQANTLRRVPPESPIRSVTLGFESKYIILMTSISLESGHRYIMVLYTKRSFKTSTANSQLTLSAISTQLWAKLIMLIIYTRSRVAYPFGNDAWIMGISMEYFGLNRRRFTTWGGWIRRLSSSLQKREIACLTLQRSCEYFVCNSDSKCLVLCYFPTKTHLYCVSSLCLCNAFGKSQFSVVNSRSVPFIEMSSALNLAELEDSICLDCI